MLVQKTILITDVVDSTALTHTLGDERMASLWKHHDRIARDLLYQYDGREGDRTDGFLMLFDQVGKAISYGLAFNEQMEAFSQREEVDFKARIGIHTGPVILMETSQEDRRKGAKALEVEGIAKPTAARIMSMAGGGQVLVSKSSLTAEDLTEAKSMGHWSLKGVDQPVEVMMFGPNREAVVDTEKAYRVVRQDDYWIPVREIKHNLPRERDSFVGRASDIQRLGDALDAAPMVTVMGPGGVGKTRICRRYAWTHLGEYPGGVYFIDLADAISKDGIESKVATVLELPAVEKLGERIGHAMAGRGRSLFILDNFEQIHVHAPATIGKWLDASKQASFLVTSRIRLGIAGERVVELNPLDVKDAAVQLFADRASHRKRDFSLDNESRAAVREIVSMLEGMPLAIELAAARISVLSVPQIRARLSQRFKLLTGGKDNLRHATLRATIDWSWDLLDDHERFAFLQLCVFENGFTLEAAEAVIDLTDYPDAPWAMDVVQELVDKSLVRKENETRFGLFAAIQEYGREKLAKDEATQHKAALRHMEFFRAYGKEDFLESLRRFGGRERRNLRKPESDNLVKACRLAVAMGMPDAATDLLRSSWEIDAGLVPMPIVLEMAQAIQALPGITPVDELRITMVLGIVHRTLSDFKAALVHFETGLGLAREQGNMRWECLFLNRMALVLDILGRIEEAKESVSRAIAIAEDSGQPVNPQWHRSLGEILLSGSEDLSAAEEHFEQAISIAKAIGDDETEVLASLGLVQANVLSGNVGSNLKRLEKISVLAEASGLGNLKSAVQHLLGYYWSNKGDHRRAIMHYSDSVRYSKESGDLMNAAINTGNLGSEFQKLGEFANAETMFKEALAVSIQANHKRAISHFHGALGWLYLQQDEYKRARKQLAEALALDQELRISSHIAITQYRLGILNYREEKYEEAEADFEQAVAASKSLAVWEVSNFAKAGLGLVLIKRGVEQEKGLDLVRSARDTYLQRTQHGEGAAEDSILTLMAEAFLLVEAWDEMQGMIDLMQALNEERGSHENSPMILDKKRLQGVSSQRKAELNMT